MGCDDDGYDDTVWEDWEGWEDWSEWSRRASPGSFSRPRRSAADRRAQARRAQGRAAQQLMRAFGELAMHRGCAPSRLGAALAEALAAQEREPSSAGPDADTGCSTDHWRGSWGRQEAHSECENRPEVGEAVDATAALSHTLVPTATAQAPTVQLPPEKRRKTTRAAAKAREGSASRRSQPTEEATRSSASEGATASKESGAGTAGSVGKDARRAAVVEAVNAALAERAERAQGGAASPPRPAVNPGFGSGGALAARGAAAQGVEAGQGPSSGSSGRSQSVSQARAAHAFGFGRR